MPFHREICSSRKVLLLSADHLSGGHTSSNQIHPTLSSILSSHYLKLGILLSTQENTFDPKYWKHLRSLDRWAAFFPHFKKKWKEKIAVRPIKLFYSKIVSNKRRKRPADCHNAKSWRVKRGGEKGLTLGRGFEVSGWRGCWLFECANGGHVAFFHHAMPETGFMYH